MLTLTNFPITHTNKALQPFQGWRFFNAVFILCMSAPQISLCAYAASESDDAIAPSVGPSTKSMILKGKAEVTQHLDSNIQAWQASQVYKQGVRALSANRCALAADCFKLAGNQFAILPGSEKFLAESRYAEAQSRRLLGQKQMAISLYKEAIELFKQYDPLSSYLKAALDNFNTLSPPLQAKITKIEPNNLQALATASGIQSVDKNVIIKGRLTDIEGSLKAVKGVNSVTAGYIKKTVLQAFVKMTCLETAELGSNYYTAADKYVPLQANNKVVAIPASSGFLAPIISVKLNGRFYNVGIDLPELSANRRTVYLVTDGKTILAIDPATYDVWKLHGKFNKQNAVFDWQKLTHKKDLPRRIDVSKNQN